MASAGAWQWKKNRRSAKSYELSGSGRTLLVFYYLYFTTEIDVKKTSQFITVCNEDAAYITQIKQPSATALQCILEVCERELDNIDMLNRSRWSSGNTLACGARGPRFASRCGQKFVFSRKSLRYAALGTGCTLTAVPRSTQPSTLRGTVNEYQP